MHPDDSCALLAWIIAKRHHEKDPDLYPPGGEAISRLPAEFTNDHGQDEPGKKSLWGMSCPQTG
jgi:hypothetical protein